MTHFQFAHHQRTTPHAENVTQPHAISTTTIPTVSANLIWTPFSLTQYHHLILPPSVVRQTSPSSRNRSSNTLKLQRAIYQQTKTIYRHPQKGMTTAFATVRKPSLPTMTLLQTKHFHCRYAFAPPQIGHEYDLIWDGIVNCPEDIAETYAANIFAKYLEFLPTPSPFHLKPLTGQDLQNIARRSSAFVESLDSLHTKEPTLIHSSLWRWIATLLNLIEQGAPWPEPATFAKSAFLRKPDTTGQNMSDYRILTLTNIICCLWAKVRCRQFGRLFRHWGDDGLLTAALGHGAADGHYDFAVRVEHALTLNYAFAGSATDLARCFDRILLK